MEIGSRIIDHIVYSVHDLGAAILEFHDLLGVAPVFGGYHTSQGTKNALLHLGGQCYLELLAIDHNNEAFSDERWMGIDLFNHPQISRWVLKSDDLASDSVTLKSYHPQMGHTIEGERTTSDGEELRWGLTMPLPSPEIELIPFVIDWSQSSAHPTDNLDDSCRLMDISLHHPRPESIEPTLRQLSVDLSVTQSDRVAIKIKVQCPNGIVEI